MRAFELVQLVVDALAERLVVHVSEQEFGAHYPAHFVQGQSHKLLLGTGVDPLHQGRSRDVLLLEGHHQPLALAEAHATWARVEEGE